MDEVEDALERTKQYFQPEHRNNVHVVWEKTINDQKLIVVSTLDPVNMEDNPTPFVFVYENNRLKHMHFQAETPQALTYVENYTPLTPPDPIIENQSPDAQFYFYLVRVYRDGSRLFTFSSDLGETRWNNLPDTGVIPDKYVIPSVFENLIIAAKQARVMHSKPFGVVTDECYEKFGNFVFKKYNMFSQNTISSDEGKEVMALIQAVAVKHGLIQIVRGMQTQEEMENKAYAVLMSAMFDTVRRITEKGGDMNG